MAIGFWKFVGVTAVLIALFRGGSNFFGNLLAAFPFSIFLWVVYRVAREQPWWASRFESLKAVVLSQVKPITAADIRPRTVFAPPPKLSLPKNKTHFVVEADVVKTVDVTPSSVGVRSKTSRSKMIRKKTVRSKRQPGPP